MRVLDSKAGLEDLGLLRQQADLGREVWSRLAREPEELAEHTTVRGSLLIRHRGVALRQAGHAERDGLDALGRHRLRHGDTVRSVLDVASTVVEAGGLLLQEQLLLEPGQLF